jgi:hypothetical protein
MKPFLDEEGFLNSNKRQKPLKHGQNRGGKTSDGAFASS